ncbi:unnamed protein product [Heterobilharzia americana]|nr:unnamed protein product [Heterobilharzia americana]CAH8592363.1 unnamed protein product [Heterobilharzia americana]
MSNSICTLHKYSNKSGRFQWKVIYKWEQVVQHHFSHSASLNYQQITFAYIKLTKSLMDMTYDLQHGLDDSENMVSFEITSLYTNIPIDMALEGVRNGLKSNKELKHRTKVPTEEIILGVRLCLTSTAFRFQNKIYKQTEGVATG